jgi:hypothetical protein
MLISAEQEALELFRLGSETPKLLTCISTEALAKVHNRHLVEKGEKQRNSNLFLTSFVPLAAAAMRTTLFCGKIRDFVSPYSGSQLKCFFSNGAAKLWMREILNTTSPTKI